MTSPHELVGPAAGFSNAVVAVPGRTVHVAGQIATDLAGRTFAEQFGGALDNVLAALHAAGARPEHVVTMTVYATDVPAYRASRKELGAVYSSRFGKHFPAMALVGVTELVEPDALVEIVATAVVP